jgi:hypothetical protein
MPTHAHTRVLIRRTYTDQVQVYFQQVVPTGFGSLDFRPEEIIANPHEPQS